MLMKRAQNENNTSSAPRSTRDRLIDVGLEQMRKHGYGATGIQEILEAAEIPRGSFYHHFGSKEDFAAAVLERYLSLEGEHCREVLGNKRQKPLRRLRRYFEDLARTAGPSSPIQGCLMGSMSLEVAGSNPRLQGCLSADFAVWQGAIASVLGEAVEAGDLAPSTDVTALAGFILNGWEGALLRSQADQSEAPLTQFLHFIFKDMLMSRKVEPARTEGS
jgi:TetR/AcrR family transcriptional repressor of nem operon